MIASVDSSGQRVSFTSTDPERELVLDDNGRGFFSALEIVPGNYLPQFDTDGPRPFSRRRLNQLTEALQQALRLPDLQDIQRARFHARIDFIREFMTEEQLRNMRSQPVGLASAQ